MEKQFKIKNKRFEIYFCANDQVEIYELNDPRKTGFIFDNLKDFNMFVNSITDIAEERIMENE